jgi:predicted deacylase
MRLRMRFGVLGAMSLQLALMATAALAQQGVVKVGTAATGVGQKSSGVIEVPAGVDAGTSIPVVVVHGAKPGPTLALVTGAHGTEYVSIIAVEKLIGVLDPAEISGTVILVPLVNVVSFEQKVPHVNPVDGKSMNRFYPGKADGTQTDRALYAITKEVVDRCDYLIDYHGGDLDESLRPYAYWGPTGKAEQDRISKDMVLAFGLDHIIIWKERPTDPAATRYLDNTASVRGKASIVVEAGHAGTVETDDVALLVNGTLSTMRALKMLPGEPRRVENPVWIAKLDDLIAEQAGIFYPLVKRGTYVSAGMKIGYATDYAGKVIQEFRAPEAGVVLHINAVPSMKKGDNILDLGVVGGAP